VVFDNKDRQRFSLVRASWGPLGLPGRQPATADTAQAAASSVPPLRVPMTTWCCTAAASH